MDDGIGIEKEFWLLGNNDVIQEPAIFNFPYDEYGFLVELRTRACTNPKALLIDFNKRLRLLEVKAKMLAFRLSDVAQMSVPKFFIEYLSPKYRYGSLLDLTANIHAGVKCSHATGIFPGYLTAGIHIHFSRYDNFGNRIQLPIYEIVRKMDWNFRSIIKKSNRIMGEYELKPYGFEFRSLPANAPLEKVVERAFKILGSV